MGGDTTIPFTLSPADLKQVMDKMNEIGFFEYPDTFIVPTGDTAAMVTPYPAYKFEVSNMQLNKHLTWEDDILNRNSQAAKLREFMRLIEGIIQSKPEYSQLPPIQGGYI
ncbi:MAG: hypothetical protein EHM64_08820 [Ignavibacteriae bacterium]|nr:MAG: hypothetical protein EHM64_08820 [Ignavibacteriota bacterium]